MFPTALTASRLAVPGTDMSALGFSLPKLEVWDAQRGRALLNLEAHQKTLYSAQCSIQQVANW